MNIDKALPTLKLPLRKECDGVQRSQRSERVVKKNRTTEVKDIHASSSGMNPSAFQHDSTAYITSRYISCDDNIISMNISDTAEEM
ncbi:hypothetical protein HUJ05_001831 [Dendroctonus ponderosae]|nr:hypothetical protein HUJ05_001831 [Dendroctonus ponderosae]